MILLLSTAHASEPPESAWFEYTYREDITGRSGEYEGFVDATDASGRYELKREGDQVQVGANYVWAYRNSEGESDGGTVVRATAFGLPSRRYATSPIDLDDEVYAATPPGELAAWMWIDPETPVGATVRILEDDCELLTRDTIAPFTDERAHEVRCAGEDDRHDDYGDFHYTYVDRFWFQATTGLVLREQVEEHHEGTLDGRPGRFDSVQTLTVTSASFAALPPVRQPEPTPFVPSTGPDPAAVTLVSGCLSAGSLVVTSFAAFVSVGFVVLLGRRARHIPDQLEVDGLGTVTVKPLTDPLALATLDPSPCTVRFRPFLEEFAARSLAAKDAVFVASDAKGRLVGLSFWDRSANIGTVLSPDSKVALNLVKRFGSDVEFFAEHRYPGPLGPQFNVHERWVLLTRAVDAELPYDGSAIVRFQPEHRQPVVTLLTTVWGESGFAPWLDVQTARGDSAFVALVDGQVVGFALACVVGGDARFLVNAVHPNFRDRGLGSELVRARLTAAYRLGVERVLVEVADWNVASLHVLHKLGFANAGELFVQSTSSTRNTRHVLRR